MTTLNDHSKWVPRFPSCQQPIFGILIFWHLVQHLEEIWRILWHYSWGSCTLKKAFVCHYYCWLKSYTYSKTCHLPSKLQQKSQHFGQWQAMVKYRWGFSFSKYCIIFSMALWFCGKIKEERKKKKRKRKKKERSNGKKTYIIIWKSLH